MKKMRTKLCEALLRGDDTEPDWTLLRLLALGARGTAVVEAFGWGDSGDFTFGSASPEVKAAMTALGLSEDDLVDLADHWDHEFNFNNEGSKGDITIDFDTGIVSALVCWGEWEDDPDDADKWGEEDDPDDANDGELVFTDGVREPVYDFSHLLDHRED